MQLINIIIALIVAIGFWKSSSKEVERKTAHASLIKCILFLVLTIGVTFFYYKSYQVATFRNYVSVTGYKGCYDTQIDSFSHNGKDYAIERLYSRDSVKYLIIMNSFANEETNYNDPMSKFIHDNVKSGFRSYCSFVNEEGVPSRLYNTKDTLDILKGDSNIKHCYDISLYSNTVPSILPFKVYEENLNEGYDSDELNDHSFSYTASKGVMNYKDLKTGYDYDTYLMTRFTTYYDENQSTWIYLKSLNYAKTINTLSFFSAADLSQCNIELMVRSVMPIGQVGMYFDIPIEVASLDVVRDNVTSRSFVIDNLYQEDGKVRDFRHYHIKLPTLSNLQLIRSLILTTLLTALLSLSATSCFFYGRKRYKKYKMRHKFHYSFRRRLVLLWIPVGKVILWTLMALIAYLLVRSMLSSYINIALSHVKLINYLTLILSATYICLVTLTLWTLYRKGIYLRDINPKARRVMSKLYKASKNIKRCLRYRRLKMFRRRKKK